MKEHLEELSKQTRRSIFQTEFLFKLCDDNFDKLVMLEEQIKNCFVMYCPGDKEEVEKVLKLVPKNENNIKI